MSLPERQHELIETHLAVQDAGLPHVVVGGWAVSAFQTRFTTDVDLVIPAMALDAYDGLLNGRAYTRVFDKDVSNVYEGRIVQYQKVVAGHPVQVDALVDSLRCRQTDAEWSYPYLEEHSIVTSLEVAAELTARIPEPSLLFAIKLHSGRLADARDLLIIGTNAEYDNVSRHLDRGDPNALSDQITGVLDRLEADGFADSFKGVFQQQIVPEDDLEELIEFLRSHSRSSK